MLKTMTRGRAAAIAVSGLVSLIGAACAQSQSQTQTQQTRQPNVRVGVLECNVGAGVGMIITSSKALNCRYRPAARGVPGEAYAGTIKKYGLDIGATGRGLLVWAVLAPSERIPRGALAGEYVGISGQATVGVGAGANVLVGGFENSINLQPLSVETQTGLNLAVGVSNMTIEPAVAVRWQRVREVAPQ